MLSTNTPAAGPDEGRPLKRLTRGVKQSLRFLESVPALPWVTLIVFEPWLRLKRRRDRSDLHARRFNEVVVVRLDEIGDAVLTTPFLVALRRDFPGTRITLVTTPIVADLFRTCPAVDRILTFDGNGPRMWRSITRQWRALRLAKNQFWRDPPDLAIVPRWDADQGHAVPVAYLTAARSVLGFSSRVSQEKQKDNPDTDVLLTHPVVDVVERHEAERPLQLLKELGGSSSGGRLSLSLGSDDFERVQSFLSEKGLLEHRGLIAIGIGAGSPRRIWPRERVANLALRLRQEGFAVVAIGGPEDNAAARTLEKTTEGAIVAAAGSLSLRHSAALLSRCDLFVGNDSAPMHLAAAAGTAVVEISCHPSSASWSGPNSPQRFGPWGITHDVVQPRDPLPPCTTWCVAESQPHCIAQVTVDDVVESILRLLDQDRKIAEEALG